MGECGCASGFGDFKIKTAIGYCVLTLYPGCTDCDTPAGLQLSFYSDDEAGAYPLDDIPDIGDYLKEPEIYLPIFDFYNLVNSDEICDMTAPTEYETPKDFVSDMQEAIRQSTITTIEGTIKQIINNKS